MLKKEIILLFILLMSCVIFTPAYGETGSINVRITQIVSKDFPEIQVYVSITDEKGATITGLSLKNFSVSEQSNLETKPQIEQSLDVDFVSKYSGVTIALLIDRSESMKDNDKIVQAKDSVKKFLELLRYQEGDRVAIIDFDSKVTVTQPFTYDKSLLVKAVDTLYPRTNTALFDAIYTAVAEISKEIGVKAVIVFTDGIENVSKHTKEEVISYAQEKNVPVYTIGLGEKIKAEPLIEIADATHAFYRYTPSASDLEAIYKDIAQKEKGQYLLTYTTHNPRFDGTTRKVTVKVTSDGKQSQDVSTYLVGTKDTAPEINLTQETKNLMTISQFAGKDITITAKITDDVKVEEARIFYRTTKSNEVYKEFLMNKSDSDIYSFKIPGADVRTPGIDFYITASDGKYVSTEPKYRPTLVPHQIAILPNNKPNITHSPIKETKSDNPIIIEAEITDRDSGDYVEWAKVYYRQGGRILYQSIDMKKVTGDIWRAVIPNDAVSKEGIDYYITASDSRGVKAYSGTDINPYHINVILRSMGPLPRIFVEYADTLYKIDLIRGY